MEIAITFGFMVLILASEAFFSGSEIAVVSADRMKLRHDAAKGSRGAKVALKMLQNPEWLLSTTLAGTNISVVANTTLATALVIQMLGEQYSWVAVVLVAPLISVFGEIVPKSIFQQRADVITPYAILILRVASIVFYPILIVFTALARLLTRIFGDGEKRNPFTLREEIMASSETDIEPSEQSLIRRVFDFGETAAADIMVPAQAKRSVWRETAHKRFTVYDERVDKIVGTLNALDLLLEDEAVPLKPFMNTPIYIPRSRSIGDLLPAIREKGVGIAVVVDEFGSAEGIVTLEDIIEEVVGEIDDEYDAGDDPVQRLRKVGEKNYIVGGRVELQMVEEEMGLEFPDGNYQTLAGSLLEIVRKIPAAGTVIRHKEITFTVKQATAQAIQEIRVNW